MRRLVPLVTAFVVLGTLVGCGSSRHAGAHSGRLYSVAQVRREAALGQGKPTGRGVVSYFGGHLLVSYEFHDRIYRWVSYLETRWSGYHTRSGVHVGSTRRALSPLHVSCGTKTECHLLAGPWPDALASRFAIRDGKVAEIDIGRS